MVVNRRSGHNGWIMAPLEIRTLSPSALILHEGESMDVLRMDAPAE